MIYTVVAFYYPYTRIHTWICPQQVAQQALIWHIRRSGDLVHLIKIYQVLRQSTMHTKDFVFYNGLNVKLILGERMRHH